MPANSLLFSRPPHWHTHKFTINPPKRLKPWLYEYDSLTQQLRQRYGRSFRVEVLFEQWRPAFIEESRTLTVRADGFQLIREVALMNADQPLILARTIIPATTIDAAHRKLSGLGNRPLGEVLFSYRDLQRQQRQICCINQQYWSKQTPYSLDIKQPIWGRRTLYSIQQHPLLVSEFFLDDLLKSQP